MAEKKKHSKKDDDISCTIEKVYGYLENDDKIYAKVSWNGKPAKDEVRRTWRDKEGDLHLGKGIELSDKDIEMLYDLYKNKPKAVDFDGLFRESEGIMERRKAGNQTKDGFLVLKRRPEAG